MAKSGEKSAENRPRRRKPLNIGWARHLVMGLGAAVIMFSGGVLLGGAAERYFEWLSALADSPPAFTALSPAAFENTGLAGEIGLAAQIDSPRSYFIDIGGREAFMAPLYPPDANEASNPVNVILLERAGAPAEEDFANWVRAVGPTAVVIEFLGRQFEPDDQTRARVAAALEAEGLRLAPGALFVDPHHRPRRVELAPRTFGMTFGGFVIGLGALLGLYTMQSLRRERRRRARMARRAEARKAREERKKNKSASPAKTPEAKTPAAKTPEAGPAKSDKSPESAALEKQAAKDGPNSSPPLPPSSSPLKSSMPSKAQTPPKSLGAVVKPATGEKPAEQSDKDAKQTGAASEPDKKHDSGEKAAKPGSPLKITGVRGD